MRPATQLLKTTLMAGIAAGGLMVVDTADAGWQGGRGGRGGGQDRVWGADRGQIRGHSGHSHGHHHHGRTSVWIGGSFWWPGYYGYPYGPYPYPYAYGYPYPSYAYAYPYSYPYSTVRAYPPPVGEAPAPKWYYCPDSRMYYPHVRECPSAWNAVPAQPAPSSQP